MNCPIDEPSLADGMTAEGNPLVVWSEEWETQAEQMEGQYAFADVMEKEHKKRA